MSADLLDDRPPRNFSPAEVQDVKDVYLFINPGAFVKRTKDNEYVKRDDVFVVSELVCQAVLEKGAHVIVLTSKEWEGIALPDEMEQFPVDTSSPIEVTRHLMERLGELGISFRRVNPRLVTWLNLKKYAIDAKALHVFNSESLDSLGIEIDKEKSFDDYVKQRQRDAWP